jgi:hypothetical protein
MSLPLVSTGRTPSDLLVNIVEALNLYFEGDGIQVTQKNVKVEIDLKQFFQYYRVINAKFLAERIGMNATLYHIMCKGEKSHLNNRPRKYSMGFIPLAGS